MEKSFKRLLSLVVAFVLVLGMVPAGGLQVYAAEADTADLTIGTVDELKAFADAVNAGNSYEGKLVVLANDIDLNYTAVVIGTEANSFKGTFDGQNHTVSNLTIYEDGSESDYFADSDDCLGLFGVLNTPGVIKNVTVSNPFIVGSSYVGGIVGMGYTGKIENCHVTGEIDIEGYYMVGGITGHGYARITDCSVIGEEGWDYNFIGATYQAANLEGDNVGGIVGHSAEDNVISGCTVKNVTVSGTRKVGGIVGITAQSTDIANCKVENVTVETTATAEYAADNAKTMSIGGIVGQYMADGNGVGGTLSGCTVSGLTFTNENNVAVNAGALTGGVRASSGTTTEPAEGNITVSGNTASAVTGKTVEYLEPEAPDYAVMIGEQGYTTLADALAAAAAMTGDVTVEIYDKVTLNSNLSGSFDSIKFVGKDTDAEIYLDVQGYITATGKKVAFENLTLSKSEGGYITNAGFMNVAFGVYDVTEVTYTGCTFANGAYASSGEVTYTGCTFYRSYDKYGLWAYGNVDVTVDGCTFADYRGIKMYAEGAAKTVDLTVKNTDFSALYSKPAIVLTYGESVTLENNTYSSTGVFELDLDGAPNGTAVTSDNLAGLTCKNDNGACGVLVDGKIYTTVAEAAAVATEGSTVTLLHDSAESVELAEGVILNKNGYTAEGITVKTAGLSGTGTEADPYLIENLEDLLWFQAKVDEQAADGSTQFAGKYFKLTADIDLAGINWNPIGSMSGDHGTFKGVFDGDGHTISNLNCQQAGNGLGLFARTAGNAEIKNLTLNNVTVKSTNNSNYVGAVVGNSYASTKITNVHVTGNIDISGRGYIGGISGHGYVVMDNVSVVGEGTISSTFWCAGGILGYGGEGATNIMNAKVEGLTITSAAGGLGSIVGMAEDNNGTQPISGSNLSAKDVEIKTYTGAYGDAYANYALGYLYGGNPTSKLTGDLKVENVTITTSSGEAPEVQDAVATVNGAIYFSLQAALDAAAAGTGNVTVEILRDVDLTGTDWNPVTVSASGYPLVTVNGNSKTITGLNDMLFAGTWAGKSGLIINDLTIQNSNIANDVEDTKGTVGVGAFIGYPQASATITLNNCHLVDSTVSGGHWTGGLIGMAGGYNGNDGPVFMNLTITGCSVTGSTITGKGSVGGVIGHGSCAAWTNVVIENTTVSGNTITSTGSSNVKAGSVMGTIGAAGQPTTAAGETKQGGAFVSVTTSNNTVTSNGTAITTIYGRQGTETGMLEITGGTYEAYPIEKDVSYAAPKTGYKIVENTDGTYGLKACNYVAQVGETKYESLDDAIKAAVTGDTVVLLQDITRTSKLTIEKAVTIDGNGHSIIADAATQWYTVGKKPLYLKNYAPWVVLKADGIELKNVVIDSNNVAGGVKIENAENVVFDNVSILGAKADALTVVGSLTLKNYLKVETSSTMLDARSGVVNAEPGTVFDMSKWLGNVSPATSDLKGVVDTEGNLFFEAYTSTGYTNNLSNFANPSNVTPLKDVTLTKDKTISGTLNLNGHDLTVAEGKAITVSGSLAVTGEGALTGNIKLTKVAATCEGPANLNVISGVDGYKVVYEGGIYKLAQIVYVAYIGEQGYETVDAAVKAAVDGDTIRLASAAAAISMNATVDGGRTITFTGEALVDWSLGNLWIGRNGTGSGKVIFKDATITSLKKATVGSTGIHVSGAKAGSTGTCDGVLEIVNSTIELDYLINRNEVIVSDNSHLTVTGGTYVHGRNADESDSGTNEVATLTVQDSKLTIVNFNGEGIGGESYGELILNNAEVVCQGVFPLLANGTVKMDADSTITAAKLTGAGNVQIDATGLTADKVVITAATAGFTGTVTATGNDKAEAKINADNIQVVIKVASYVAQNVNTGVYYTTVAEALNTAASGEVVKLLADAEVSYQFVKMGVTLDLNGHKLTATYLAADFEGTYIIDNTDGNGLLYMTAENTLSLNQHNSYMPIKTAEGYRFYKAGLDTEFYSDNGYNDEDLSDGSIKLHFAFDYDNDGLVNVLKANGGAAENVKVRVLLSWTNDSGSYMRYYYFDAEDVQSVAANHPNEAFYLAVTGTTEVTQLQITAEMVLVDANGTPIVTFADAPIINYTK